jgi:hypothetical protein
MPSDFLFRPTQSVGDALDCFFPSFHEIKGFWCTHTVGSESPLKPTCIKKFAKPFRCSAHRTIKEQVSDLFG